MLSKDVEDPFQEVNPELLAIFDSPEFDANQAYSRLKDNIEQVTSATGILSEQIKNLSSLSIPSVTSSLQSLDEVEKKIQNDVMPQIKMMLSRIDGLRDRLIEPFNRINSSVLLLKRLKITCDLLRTVIRVLSLCKRIQLRTSFDTNTDSGVRDLIKSAQLLNELNQLLDSEPDIKRITEVSKELQSVNMVKGLIVDKCHTQFKGGLNSPEITGKNN